MKRNKFSLSNYKLLTCNMGQLIPVNWTEVIPGDVFQQKTQALIRCAPLLAPVMHPVKVRIHHFFVPYRLIWDSSGGANTGFEDFITGGPDGTSTPTFPRIFPTSVSEGDLLDYLGIPPATYSGGTAISALPVRAYNLIFNEFYRDQDLVTARTIDKTSGADTTSTTSLASVAWEKDLFTTCRPWESKGDSITIPLAADAYVKGIGTADQTFNTSAQTVYESDGTTPEYTWSQEVGAAANDFFVQGTAQSSGIPNITADLTTATGISIGDLLLSFGLQNFQEARAKYGSRYVEYLRYLGVRPQDGRLNEPEYLGGGKQVIQFSEVLSTDGANTGKMYGHGITALQTNKYRRFFAEHGMVMTLMSVVPKAIYASGIARKFLKSTKEEFFNKELQFIGDQVVTNREIYSEDSGPGSTFGYQPRYEEYRAEPSGIAGEFRTTNDYWHFARIFTSDPALNSTFVSCSPSTEPFAAPSTDQLYCMVNNSIQARRPISREGKSKLLF